MYNYFLGGTLHEEVDRVAARQTLDAVPETVEVLQCNRAFLSYAVRYLTRTVGLTQFIDIGSALPLPGNNVHDIGRESVPDAKVLYVDADRFVTDTSRGVLAGVPRLGFLNADVRDIGKIFQYGYETGLIDPALPVGLLCVAVLQFVSDDATVRSLLSEARRLSAPGSHLVISHPVPKTEQSAGVSRSYNAAQAQLTFRSVERVRSLVKAWKPLDPGLTELTNWLHGTGIDESAGRWFCGAICAQSDQG
jgi:hypothetical protein